jgi:DNA-binding LacI/PurR family transcriptional regulator
VRRVAQEMGYRPNRLARSLGRRKTDTIGLLISGLKNAFFVELLESAETLTLEAGYDVMLDAAPSLHSNHQARGRVRNGWPVDGALVWATGGQHASEFLGAQADSIPVVYLGAIRKDETDWVSFDYEAGGRQATEHLVTRGYRRIAFLAPSRIEELRNIGYRKVMEEAGLPLSYVLTDNEETRAAGVRAALQIAEMPAATRPDAVFCHNDMLAVGVYCGLRRAGLQAPDDLAIVGFDGVEETQFTEVPLTTVGTDNTRLCRHALSILTRRLNGDVSSAQEGIVVPTELIIGQST